MKLIKNDLYLLLIDEEAKIMIDDLFYPLDNKGYITRKSSNSMNTNHCGKIIAYYPLNSETKELDLPLLPPFKETVKYYGNTLNYWRNNAEEDYSKVPISVLKYIAVLEEAVQSKQFSLEDMKEAMELGLTLIPNNEYNQEHFDKFIQSLSTQQLPKEFIPEYEYVESIDDLWEFQDDDSLPKRKLKTITNSEGKEELVGFYKY